MEQKRTYKKWGIDYDFFNTSVKQKILKFFVNSKLKEFCILDISKETGITHSSMSVYLKDFSKQKVFSSERKGKYMYYTIDPVIREHLRKIYYQLDKIKQLL